MKNSITKKHSLKEILRHLIVAVFWITIWQLLYMAVGKDILLVSPLDSFLRLLELSASQEFWQTVFLSCIRIISGFLASLIAGVIIAYFTSKYKAVNMFVSPVIKIIRVTPVASFIILTLLWVKSAYIPALMAFLMVVPLVWANVYEGIISTDEKLLEMAYIYKLGRYKILRYIYIPALMPYFKAAITTGLGFAWKSGVAAEIIVKPLRSLGKEIYDSKIYIETKDLFAWTITVIIISVIIEKVTLLILKKAENKILKT